MPSILIVDDSMLQRLKLKKLFSSNGFETKEANSGEQALELLGKGQFDAISLDLLMPGIGGLGFLKETQGKQRPPVVVISADIQETVHSECMELGANGFLNKPSKDEEVLRTFSKLIA